MTAGFTTPKALAADTGWSERLIRKVARGLGACHVMGNRMSLTRKDAEGILAVCGDAELAKDKPPPAPRPDIDTRGFIYVVECAIRRREGDLAAWINSGCQ